MTLLIITMIYVIDIIARTYITSEGICYETQDGTLKWITGRKRKVKSNGKDAK